jgi:hypothetical protein
VETKVETKKLRFSTLKRPARERKRKMKSDKSVTALDKPYEPTADQKAAPQAIRERKTKAPRVRTLETKAGIEFR